jgi:hypothetical protein
MGDTAQIIAARSAVDATCRCFAYDGKVGKRHNDYVSCAKAVIDTRTDASQLRPDCKATVTSYYTNSVCGYVRSVIDHRYARVPVVTLDRRNGMVHCTVKQPGVYLRPSRSIPPWESLIECYGSTTCIDAGDTDGDQRIDASDGGTCTPGDTYTDNGDGTITDNQTGLMWEKKDDSGGLHDWDNRYSSARLGGGIVDWLAQLNAEGGTGFAGYSDWRIPTLPELQTLLRLPPGLVRPLTAPEFHQVGYVPGCDVTTCSLTYSGLYWTITGVPGLKFATNEWAIDFNTDAQIDYETSGAVRAVRGGH